MKQIELIVASLMSFGRFFGFFIILSGLRSWRQCSPCSLTNKSYWTDLQQCLQNRVLLFLPSSDLLQVGEYSRLVGTYLGQVGLYSGCVSEYSGTVGKYSGFVGEYSGSVGEYLGAVGEYAGAVGEYAGDVGVYEGIVGLLQV